MSPRYVTLPSGRRGVRRHPVRRQPAQRSSSKLRMFIGIGIVAFALISYCSSKEYNPVTGEEQHIALTPHQEVALGLQAVPEMMAQHGGEHPDPRLQDVVNRVGFKIVNASPAGNSGWEFHFHLLRDPRTINAFALPGGQVFITYALFERLETEGQLAGVLGHEIGHVVARHSAQRMAKEQLSKGVTTAVLVASGSSREAMLAQAISSMVNMKYGRDDELQSDSIGVAYMSDAGYDPRAMIGVQQILAQSSPGGPPEWLSTHPSTGNRIATIEAAIDERWPEGVPDGLIQ